MRAAESVGAPGLQLIGPRQFYGLEVNVFAHELASIAVWIGFLRWNHLNGLSNRQMPVLERLDTIRRQDALLDGEDEAQQQGVPQQSPVLQGERLSDDALGEPKEFCAMCYRADQYRYYARLVRR